MILQQPRTFFQSAIWCGTQAFMFGMAAVLGIAAPGLFGASPFASVYIAMYVSPFCWLAGLPVAIVYSLTTRQVSVRTGVWRGAVAATLSQIGAVAWLASWGSYKVVFGTFEAVALAVAAILGSLVGALLAKTEQSNA